MNYKHTEKYDKLVTFALSILHLDENGKKLSLRNNIAVIDRSFAFNISINNGLTKGQNNFEINGGSEKCNQF